MTDLIALACADVAQAVCWRARLQTLQRTCGIELADLALVVARSRGRWQIRRSPRPWLAGALGGAFWGGLIGMLLGLELYGSLLGGLLGAVYGRRVNFGLDHTILADVAQELRPGEAAVVALVRRIDLDAAWTAWAAARRSARLLRVTLPATEATRLQQLFSTASEF